jgi:sugar lactone lactonase YvrE
MTFTTSASVLVDSHDLCGEGPLWDERSQSLYWTDQTSAKFQRYDYESHNHTVVKAGFGINGFALQESAGFIVTNDSGIWSWDANTEPRLIVAEVNGAKCKMNDCIADPEGRLFSGSVFYDPSEDYQRGKLMRVDVDGSAHVLDEGFHISNGLAFSLDLTCLYFTDSGARRIYQYDYDRASGEIGNRRILVQVQKNEGLPDGLTVDSEGFLWSAQWYGSCIVRYDPDGREERRIPIPAKQVSSVTFGGPDLTDIFVTSAGLSEPMPVMPAGYDANQGHFGGQVFRLRAEVPGRLEFRTRVLPADPK